MCDPLTIAGLALTAGSTVANTMAQNKVAKARSQVMSAERVRQAGLDQQAQALNATSQDRYKTFTPDMEKRGAKLGDYFNTAAGDVSAASGAASETALPTNTDSAVTVQETARQQGAAKNFNQQQGAALGTLRSFGDYLGDTSRSQAREAGLIGQIGGFKKGSSDVVPFELESAAHKGDSLKLFGDLLGFGGQLATGKGLQGDWSTIGGSAPTLGDPWSGLRDVTTSVIPKSRSSLTVADLGLSGRYGGPR